MKRLFLTLLFLLVATVAAGQTVINPTRVEFTVSLDHAVVLADGQPMVTSYDVRFYAAGASEPTSVSSIGKPDPDGSGVASVDISSVIIAFPVSPTTQYVARVAAVGPTGEGVSDPSNPFLRVAPPRAASRVIFVKR